MNDLKGKRFSRLIVLKDSGKRCGGHVVWICICDCGNICEVIGNNLIRGRNKSCGCLKKENAIKKNWRHGDRRIRLYRTWVNMKSRCFRKNHHKYKYYGGRGITVCPAWRSNYLIFKEWALANGYADHLTIDRIDNDGNYEPNNCQWLTRSENSKKQWEEKHGSKDKNFKIV